MKHLKKLFVFVMVFAMLLPLGGRMAFAAEGSYNFVVKNESDKDYAYVLYQMLVGDIATVGGEKILSNVQWGDGVKEETKDAMYKMANLTDANRTAAKFAEWLAKQDTAVFHKMMEQVNVNDGSSLKNPRDLNYGTYDINGTSTVGYGLENLPGGYYLVRNTAVPEGQTYSDYIVFVLNSNLAVEPKSASAPTPEKKVTDKNDSTPTSANANATGDSADYDIGDTVPYTLSVSLPTNYDNYVAYKLVFKDEMSKGLTYNGDAKIHYGANDTEGTAISLVESTSASPRFEGSKTYTYTIENLKTDAYTQYNLQSGSLIWISYTATLNKDAVIGSTGNPNVFTVEYSNNPTGMTMGVTEPDQTTVFTFQLVFNKVDGENQPLSGADFKLSKWISNAEGTDGEWKDVTTLGEGENKPTKEKSASGETSDSVFTFKGLDDGKYRLEETVTPMGYNTIQPIEFTVAATHDTTSTNPQLTGLSGLNGEISFTMTADPTTGTLSSNIKNESGAVLPTTGAEGTMFLVLAGTIIAFLGIVVLVTRRRLRAE